MTITIKSSSRDKLARKHIVVIGGTSGYARHLAPAAPPPRERTSRVRVKRPKRGPSTATNTASRIGFGCALTLLEHRARITVVSSQQAHVTEARDRLNKHVADGNAPGAAADVQGFVGDLRDEAAFTALLRSLAPVDHVVFTPVDRTIRGPLADADLSEAKHLFGVKFWGGVVVAKALAAHDIVSPGGSLTLTSGAAALRGSAGAAVGAALNGGVIALTRSLAAELAGRRIRVNTVVPGLCRTELWDKLGHSREAQEQVLARGAQELSVGFVGGPEDVAEAYLYLVRADYANGTTVVIGEQRPPSPSPQRTHPSSPKRRVAKPSG